MSDLAFLTEKHPIFTAHEQAWKREERRLHGGDAVLDELTQWKGESTAMHDARKQDAYYPGFPEIHAAVLSGHLARVRPQPGKDFSLGTLGTISAKSEQQTDPTNADVIYYNLDGIGVDGSEWGSWTDGVQARACATGHRWVLVEMPALADVRGQAVAPGSQPTQEDVRRGFRPYAVEFSPLAVTNWSITRGQLDFAVIRLPVGGAYRNGVRVTNQMGYYLLVRSGFSDLGPSFANGGWWIYDSDRKLVKSGQWTHVSGAVPLIPFLADESKGTYERPALSKSLTTELGQLAVSLMRLTSARDYNAVRAAKATDYILGANPAVDPQTQKPEDFNLTVEMQEAGALLVPVFAYKDEQGNIHQPTLWNSSAAAVPAEIFAGIIQSKYDEARERMIRAMAGPDASGASREADFAQAKSPLLARLAANRQRFEQALIWFLEARAGAAQPTGFSIWPRDFELKDLVESVDEMLETLNRARVSSSTLESSVILQSAKERGFIQDDETEQTVSKELAESAARASEARAQDRAALDQLDRDLDRVA